MKFSKKLLKAISMMALCFILILGSAFSSMTVLAEKEMDDGQKVLKYVQGVNEYNNVFADSDISINYDLLSTSNNCRYDFDSFDISELLEMNAYCYDTNNKLVDSGEFVKEYDYTLTVPRKAAYVKIEFVFSDGKGTIAYSSPMLTVIGLVPLEPKEEPKDLGSYTIDLSKGSCEVINEEYMAVIENISANCSQGRAKELNISASVVQFDINKDGYADIELKYEWTSSGVNGIYSKCNGCTITGTYALYCKTDEIFSPIDMEPSPFYSTVIFKFTDDAPTVNTDTNTNTDQKTIAAPEKKETLDPSIKVPSLNKLQKTKKSIKVTWKKISKKALKNIEGFEIQCSTDKSFTTIVKQTTVKKNKTSVSIKKLTPGKKYFVRVRAYKKVNGEMVYSK